MSKTISPKIVSLAFGILVLVFVVGFYISAWQEPGSAPPPADNVLPPLNVSYVAQEKVGGLILNTGGADNGLIVDKGNVGIGTITPAYKLDVRGGQINASGGLCIAGVCKTSWGEVGSYWAQSSSNLYPNNTNWNVGIGTASPRTALEVDAPNNKMNLILTPNATFNSQTLSGIAVAPGGSLITLPAFLGSGLPYNLLYARGGGDITFLDTWNTNPNNTQTYYTGNVGIGETSPDAKLDVLNTGAGDSFRVDDDADGDTTPFIIDASGNVGIGTASPNNKLQVAGLVNFDDAKASTLLGYQAGRVNTGPNNTFVGYLVGYNNTGGLNTAVGSNALYYNTTGGGNTAIGTQALYNNITGNGNTAIGDSALVSNANTGDYNIAIGSNALIANTSGSNNIAIGFQVLVYNQTGYNNLAIGRGAGFNNVAGSGNVFLGYNAGENELGSNKLYIDNSNTSAPLISGDFNSNTLTINGNLNVTGVKAFMIEHPLKAGYELVHATLEGPENAVFYRGTAELQNGEAIVKLPDYFEALTRKDGRTVQLTAKGREPYLLSYTDIANGEFIVYGNKQDGEFSWEVKAVRADVDLLKVEMPKEE